MILIKIVSAWSFKLCPTAILFDFVFCCEVHNLNPRIDESNLENIYTRNKIRLELIPYMKDNFNTNLIESIHLFLNSDLASDSI